VFLSSHKSEKAEASNSTSAESERSLILSPKFYTVIDAEDYKTIISNCSSVPYMAALWKYKVINFMGVKRGRSQ